MLSQRKSLFFFLIQLFCSLAQELTVGVVSRLLLPTYCRTSQELHHLASEDQLSENTFVFAPVARTPFCWLPSFTGAEHEVRQFLAPVEPRALRRGYTVPGSSCLTGTGLPQIHLQPAQIISAPVLGKTMKAWVFRSSWPTPAGSNPFCLLTFCLEFLLDPCPSPPSSLRASLTPWLTLFTLCPSHSFT